MQAGVIIMEDLSKFISTVGFPIVVAIAMFYQNNTLSTNYQQITKGLQDKIEANTLVMQQLISKLISTGVIKDGVEIDNTNNK